MDIRRRMLFKKKARKIEEMKKQFNADNASKLYGSAKALTKEALESVEKRLDSKYGIVLLQPAYTKYHVELGEITSYPPGYGRYHHPHRLQRLPGKAE